MEPGSFNSGGETAGQGAVVVFDQDGVVQSETVVGSPTAAHGVLFEGAQAGCGLAGADDLRAMRRDDGDEVAGGGGDAAEAAEEVESGALGGEEDARRASHGGEEGTGLGVFSVTAVRHGLHGRVERAEGGEGDLQAGDTAGVTDGDVRFALQIRRQTGIAGQVSGAAEVFFERAADDGLVEEWIERRGQIAHRACAPAASARTGCAASSNSAEPSGAAVR